jgi:tetraacyldisaccharide 4'-kinase
MASRLQAAWSERGLLACALWPVSWVYGALWRVRTALYQSGIRRSDKLHVPVIVVGNVVVGGAGKTPTVVELVRHLQAQGWRPGIVSRGHGRQGAQALEVLPHSDPAATGDEPLLLAHTTAVPVVVGRRRVEAARILLARHPQVNLIVSDDGMQHWALARDVTVVVFDARGVGNGWLLPAGLLREPWPALPWGSGPMLVVQTAPGPRMTCPWPVFSAGRALSPEVYNAAGESQSLTALRDVSVVGACAGIAQPQAFFDMLHTLGGVRITYPLPLPDHADASTLLAALLSHPADITWLCTEKDAVKLFPACHAHPGLVRRVWAVPLLQTLESAFWPALEAALPTPMTPAAKPAKPLSSGHGHQTS